MEDTMRKLAWEGLQRYIAMDGYTMINKKRGELLDPEIDSHTGKTHFKLIFIVFIDHKITCRKTEKLHIVDRTDTLNT